MSYRKKIWKKAFKETIHHPYKLVLGLGIGGFITYSEAIYTHSIWLSFFFDMGITGILILCALAIILISNFWRCLRRAKRTDSYYLFLVFGIALFAVVGVQGLIDFDFYSYTAKMFWFPLSIFCASYNVIMSENPELSKPR
jgi:O-antigen ligase